jgi:AbrB family looped-hinge helix DNA binding protein
MVRASLSTKGQLVIPKVIRERLGLHAGDKVDFIVQDNGGVLLIPAKVDIRSLKGCLKPPKGKVVSLEDMERAIREQAGRLP